MPGYYPYLDEEDPLLQAPWRRAVLPLPKDEDWALPVSEAGYDWPMPISPGNLAKSQTRTRENAWQSPIQPRIPIYGPNMPPEPTPPPREDHTHAAPEGSGPLVGQLYGMEPSERAEFLSSLMGGEAASPQTDSQGALEALAMSAEETQGQEPLGLPPGEGRWQRQNAGEIQKLRGLRSIAEGLGNIRWSTPGHYYLGIQPREPNFEATGIREMLAERSDLMSPAERQMIKSRWGMEVSPETRWSRMREVLPNVSRAIHGGLNDAITLRKLEQADKRLAAQAGYREDVDRRFGVSSGQRQQGLDQAQTRLERPPTAFIRDRGQTQFLVNEIHHLADRFEAVKNELGPIWGRWNQVARKLGIGDPAALEVIATQGMLSSQFVYLMTGKQLNEAEMHRLNSVLPQAYDSPETFIRILRNFTRMIEEKSTADAEQMEAHGFKVAPLDIKYRSPLLSTEDPETTTASQDKAAMEAYINENGVTAWVPAGSDMTKALRKGWKKK